MSGSLPERAGDITNLVTHWWVERCLFGKRLIDPTSDVLSRPFDKLSINGKLLASSNSVLDHTDVFRILWPNCKLHGIFRYRASACDESYHLDGYGNNLCSFTYN